MKVLLCLECGDLVKLYRGQHRSCMCRRSEGQYLEDDITAEVRGACILLGLDNATLERAIREKYGSFVAFVIPPGSDTVIRTSKLRWLPIRRSG